MRRCWGWKWRESTKNTLKKINENILKTFQGDALILWSNFVPPEQSSWIMPSVFRVKSHIDQLHSTLYKPSYQFIGMGFKFPHLNFNHSLNLVEVSYEFCSRLDYLLLNWLFFDHGCLVKNHCGFSLIFSLFRLVFLYIYIYIHT